MKTQARRVLLVEDWDSARSALKEVLELEGLTVSEASDRDGALEAIRRVAFHVICIDLGLDPDDPTNLHGREVLKEVARREEGTRTIIVSQKEVHHVTVEAYERFHLDRYFRKGQFTIQQLADGVREEAHSATLSVFQSYTSPFDALLHEIDQDLWIHEALQVLSPKEGYITLRRGVDGMVGRLIPVRPHRLVDHRAVIRHEENSVYLSFWSRAQGSAMRCYLQRPEADPPDGDLIETFSLVGLKGWTVAVPDESIDAFLE